MPHPDLVSLDDLDPDRVDSARFGGKAVGLSRLRRAGLTTPGGFAVAARLEGPDEWSAGLRAAFESEGAALLAGGAVAVRSSGEGEDSAERSFAGLFESRLGVSDLATLLVASRECVESGGAARVMEDAGTAQPVPVGLIVQRMAQPEFAGVLFTRDPAGGPAIVVEAARGTGEALASGHVAPERWRVYQVEPGQFELRREGGPEPALLSGASVVALAATASGLVEGWGFDLDLEWAITDDGSIVWLQARPITTGEPWRPPAIDRSASAVEDVPVTVWTNANLRENVPEPLHPLGWGVLREGILPYLTRDLLGVPRSSRWFDDAASVDLIGSRLYFNLNGMLASPMLHGDLPRFLRFIDERDAETAARLIADGILVPRRIGGGWAWRKQAQARTLLRSIGQLPLMLRPMGARRALALAARRIGARPAPGCMSDAALVRELRLFDSPAAGVLRDGLSLVSLGFLVWMAAERAFGPWPEARRLLTAGIEGNPTTAISIGIDRLVERARPLARRFETTEDTGALLAHLRDDAGTDDAAALFLRELEEFLAENGQRCPREMDLGVPRWIEEPGMVLELVRTGLAAPTHERVVDRLARLRAERETAVAGALADAPAWRRPIMRWLARAVTLHMPMREAPKHHILKLVLRMRRCAAELGRRLAERGRLKATGDVFFLDLLELEATVADVEPAPLDLAALVERRRADLAEAGAKRAPSFLRSDGVPVDEPFTAIEEDGALLGAGIGGGRGEGPVRILDEPDPRRVSPGDVLVVELADPGWTPLFPRVAGLVMEVGGTMCHAAVIARELGVPAVFGVAGARERLREGARVVVDGDAGRVEILAEPDGAGADSG